MEVDINICLNNAARIEVSSLAKQFLIERINKYSGDELQDNVRDTGLIGVPNDVIKDRLKNPSISKEEKRRLGRVNNQGYTMVPTDWRSWSDGAFDTSG